MPNLAIKPWDPKTPNSDVIAAIWEEAGSDFQRRVPEPTKASLDESIKSITNYQPNYNEFAAALINKVGLTIARNNSWTNPLAAYKIGLMEFGESIEEYQTGLVKAHVYDPRREYGEKALFGRHGIDVQANYHTINRENMYPLTVDHPVLKRAFNSESGLAQYVTSLMAAPATSDNWDEFLIMASLFRQYEDNGGLFKVHVDDIAAEGSTDSQSRRALRSLREYAEILPFLSTRYNAARMPVHANPDDMVLFTTPQFKAALDVEALAQLFNVSYAEVPYKVTTLPQEHFNMGDVQAVLTTKDFFVVADTYFDTTSQPNPAGRYENWFLHHDGIYSVSRFVPAIGFTTGEGTVIEISDTPVTGVSDITITDDSDATVSTVARGAGYLVDANAETDGFNDAVVLTVSGFQSPYSYIAQTGTLHVAVNDPTSEITITARAEDGDGFEKSRTVTVTGALVEFWPNPSVTPDADSDGLLEVSPVDLVEIEDTVTIPSVKGVQYRKEEENVANGSVHTIAAETNFDAVARAGYEIEAGATTSWTFGA